MATKRVTWVFLAVVLAVVAALVASAFTPHKADAGLVTVRTCSGGSIELTNAEKSMLERHNHARTRHGLKALCVHPDLTRAARAHSQEMLDKDRASHYSSNGESVKQRLVRYGYTSSGYSYYAIGENLAWGCGSHGSPGYIFDWWMHSPDHRSNILNAKFRQVGIGARTGTFQACHQATMYTVDFGTRRR